MPFDSDEANPLDQLLGFRLLDISGHGDRLIAINSPCHLLQHPNKAIWMVPEPEQTDASETPRGQCLDISAALQQANLTGYSEAKAIFFDPRVPRPPLSGPEPSPISELSSDGLLSREGIEKSEDPQTIVEVWDLVVSALTA
ncbi:MAG: hypothetical protein ABI823_07990 [Bryobacteraceae bacterium]